MTTTEFLTISGLALFCLLKGELDRIQDEKRRYIRK